jgi:hypothetical protein
MTSGPILSSIFGSYMSFVITYIKPNGLFSTDPSSFDKGAKLIKISLSAGIINF